MGWIGMHGGCVWRVAGVSWLGLNITTRHHQHPPAPTSSSAIFFCP